MNKLVRALYHDISGLLAPINSNTISITIIIRTVPLIIVRKSGKNLTFRVILLPKPRAPTSFTFFPTLERIESTTGNSGLGDFKIFSALSR